MKQVSITEAKRRLSRIIDGLKPGDPVLIVDRGRPVARLEPAMNRGRGEQNTRLSRLIRDGIVRPARTALPLPLFAEQRPRYKNSVSVVAALITERRKGR